MSVDWIDLIRTTKIFELFEQAKNENPKIPPITYQEYVWHCWVQNGGNSSTPFKLSIDKAYPVVFNPNEVGFLFMTNPVSMRDVKQPYAPNPAPAQRAEHISMIWTDDNKTLDQMGFDETVGVFPPENAINVNYEEHSASYIPGSGSIGQTGTFQEYYVRPHRTDGFPAVITIGNLQKHYNQHGELHRSGNAPAIKADYVGALWFDEGRRFRSNGPSGVLLRDYREFHQNGQYEGFRCKTIHETWDDNITNINELLENVVGKRRPLSNRYFEDPSDEMIFLAA